MCASLPLALDLVPTLQDQICQRSHVSLGGQVYLRCQLLCCHEGQRSGLVDSHCCHSLTWRSSWFVEVLEKCPWWQPDSTQGTVLYFPYHQEILQDLCNSNRTINSICVDSWSISTDLTAYETIIVLNQGQPFTVWSR